MSLSTYPACADGNAFILFEYLRVRQPVEPYSYKEGGFNGSSQHRLKI
jgi:hypothetical protein